MVDWASYGLTPDEGAFICQLSKKNWQGIPFTLAQQLWLYHGNRLRAYRVAQKDPDCGAPLPTTTLIPQPPVYIPEPNVTVPPLTVTETTPTVVAPTTTVVTHPSVPPLLGPNCPLFYPGDLARLGDPSLAIPTVGRYDPLTHSITETPSPGQFGTTTPAVGNAGFQTVIGDTVRFYGWSTPGSTTIVFNGTFQPTGSTAIPFQQTVVANSGVTAVTVDMNFADGLITSITAMAQGGVGANAVDVKAELGDITGGAFVPRVIILSGTLSDKAISQPVTATFSGSVTATIPSIVVTTPGIYVAPNSRIEFNLSGRGPGSTWALNYVHTDTAGVTTLNTITLAAPLGLGSTSTSAVVAEGVIRWAGVSTNGVVVLTTNVYVVVRLSTPTFGANPYYVDLIRNYIGDNAELCWPNTPIVSSLSGPGVIFRPAPTNSATTISASAVVPSPMVWQLEYLECTYTPAGGHPADQIVVNVFVAALVQQRYLASGAFVAGAANTVYFNRARTLPVLVGNRQYGGLPDDSQLVTSATIVIQSLIANTAGDTTGSSIWQVREWVDFS